MKELKAGIGIVGIALVLFISACTTPTPATGVSPVSQSTPLATATSVSPSTAETTIAIPGPSTIPMRQVPESEMTHIEFSLSWILENDALPDDPHSVKITFPSSWVTSWPPVPKGDVPVELRVPFSMLFDHNESTDPGQIVVVFPNAYFKGLPDPPYVPGTPSPQLIREPPAINFFTPPGVDPPAEELLISAIAGPLTWSLSCDAPWVSISAMEGDATSAKEAVTISADAKGLAAGTYTANMTLRWDGTDRLMDIPVRLFVTSAGANELLDIPVEPDSSKFPANGLKLEQVSVSTTTLSRAGNGRQDNFFDSGDLALVIKGVLRNNTTQDLRVHYYANGYDSAGTDVSWNLGIEPGPVVFIASMDIPARTSKDFTLHISWSEEVKVIKFFANSYDSRSMP